jgi:tetratricopeptide (TPR) repeat protein
MPKANPTSKRTDRSRPGGEAPTAAAPPAVGPGLARAFSPWVVAAVTLLAFLNAAPNAFVFDDANFLPIPRGQGESIAALIGRLFAGNVWPARRLNVEAYRPISFSTMALDGLLYNGALSGFHATSIALHVGVTVLLYFVLRTLLERTGRGPRAAHGWLAAAAAATVFGVHPIHTESVDCVFNRSDMLVALCTLAAIAVVVRWHRSHPVRAWSIAALVYLVALFCKESAVTLPALIAVVLAALCLDGPLRQRARGVAPAAFLAVPLALFLAARYAAIGHATWSYAPLVSTAESLALTLTGFRDMLALVLWPHPLRAVRTDYVAWAVPLALAVLAAYGLAIYAAWRKAPGVAAGLLFFAIAAVPSLAFFTNVADAQPMADRYAYLPSVGLAIALAFGLAELDRRAGAGPVLAVGAVGVAVLFPITRSRNEVWHNDVALFEAEVAAAPANTEVMLDLAFSYASAGRPDEQLAVCARNLGTARPGLERLYMSCGRLLEGRGQFAEAEKYFRAGLGGDAPPVDYIVYGRFLHRFGRGQEAESQYQRAIELERDPVRQHVTRAEMLLKLHPQRLGDALAEIDKAVAQDPAFEIAQGLRRRIVAAIGSGAAGTDAARAAPPAPVAAPAQIPNDGQPWPDAHATETLLRVLATAPPGSPAWLTARADDPGAIARAEALAAIFKRAGWQVRTVEHTSVAVRPGLFVYGGDEEPPEYVHTVHRALDEAGLSPMFATGYRSYLDEMSRTRPDFRGIALTPEQTFVVVFGRTP